MALMNLYLHFDFCLLNILFDGKTYSLIDYIEFSDLDFEEKCCVIPVEWSYYKHWKNIDSDHYTLRRIVKYELKCKLVIGVNYGAFYISKISLDYGCGYGNWYIEATLLGQLWWKMRVNGFNLLIFTFV